MCMNAHVHTQMYTYIHVYKYIIYIEHTHTCLHNQYLPWLTTYLMRYYGYRKCKVAT